MEDIIIISDLHIGAPHEILEMMINDGNTYLVGDIFDLKNTPKNKLDYYLEIYKDIKKEFGDKYILGNHECEKPRKYYHKKDNYLFCHGHTLLWSDKMVKKWENKKLGKNKFSYFLYRIMHFINFEGGIYKPSQELKDKCWDLCKQYNCDTIIFGHTHKQCDIFYKGIRIINAPRGKIIIKDVI